LWEDIGRAVENSFDTKMGMTNNQYQNPHKPEAELDSDLRYAQEIDDLADEAVQEWLIALGGGVTVEYALLEKIYRLKIITRFSRGINKGLNKVVEKTRSALSNTSNLAAKTSTKLLGQPISQGAKQLEWIMAKHGPNQLSKYAGKSQFYISSQAELQTLIQNATHICL
jgi:hypothetical protein